MLGAVHTDLPQTWSIYPTEYNRKRIECRHVCVRRYPPPSNHHSHRQHRASSVALRPHRPHRSPQLPPLPRGQNRSFLFSPCLSLPTACPSAKEVAQCLAHVVASAKLLQKALPKRAAGRAGSGGGGSGDGDGGLSAVLEAFMRGLKTVAVVGVPGSSPLVASVRGACQEFGSEVSAEVVKRAASFLLQSLESLTGGPEV